MIKAQFIHTINHLLGDSKTCSLESRIFNSVMILTCLTSCIATIYNIFLANQIILTACSATSILITALTYRYSWITGNHRPLATPVVLYFLFIMIVSWLTNDGTHGAGGYFFFLLMTIGILLMNKPLPMFMVTIVVTLIALLAVEFYYPSLLIGYDNRTQQFLDVGISLILCIVFNGMMIHVVFRQYLKERVTKDELLSQAIRDKEELQQAQDNIRVLLREVYHRTKNNMLVIVAMLNLRAMETDDETVREVFRETENRIRAMSLVHEQLYQSQNLSALDFGAYLRGMVTTLVQNMIFDNRVAVEIDCPPQRVSIDTAVPLGLAVNEIVTNSLKHAFPDGRTGKIQIGMKIIDDAMIELRIGDDGIGLSAEKDLENPESFGLQITANLVQKQLKGTLSVNRENGTRYTLRFPELKRTEPALL